MAEVESFLLDNNLWGFSNSDNSAGNPKQPDAQMAAGAKNDVQVKKRGRRCPNKPPKDAGDVQEGKGGESDHEIHIWTERERRKKMRNMFANLHALLPQLPPKADKSTIVDEAVNYIKTLEQSLEKLQKQKIETLKSVTAMNYEASTITTQKPIFESREAFLADQGSTNNVAIDASNNTSNSLSVLQYPPMFQTWSSPNVVLNICGDKAQFSVCSPKKPGLLSAICLVLEKHQIEVLSAHVSSDSQQSMFMIQGQVNSNSDKLAMAFPVDEIYKQAAGEIMLLVSS